MKMKLPKALLLAVLASSVAYAAETVQPDIYYDNDLTGAFVVKQENIFTTNDALTKNEKEFFEQKTIEGSTNASPIPLVKDGEKDTYTINQDLNMYNPLVVREGTLKVENCTITSLMNSSLNSYVPFLSVGGKNAVLELNKAIVKQSIVGTNNYCVAMSLGGPDGVATVNLKGGSTLHTDHYIMAGDPDGQRYSLTTWGTKPAQYAALGTGYSKGTVNEGTNAFYNAGDKDAAHRTVINVEGGSTLSAGTSLQFGDVDVNISGKGSIVKDNTRGLKSVSNHTSYLGHEGSYDGDIATNIVIANGGTFESNWNLSTGGKARAENPKSTVDITVGSEESQYVSTFKVKGHFAMGDNLATDINNPVGEIAASANSEAKLTVNKKGVAYLNIVTVGDEGKGELIVNEGGRVVKVEENERYNYLPYPTTEATTPHITVNETGTVTINGGSVDIDMALNGGTLTMTEDAVAAGLTATTGTITLSGNVTFTGAVMLGDGTMVAAEGDATPALTINIEQGSTLIFEKQVELSNAVINVLLSDEAYEGEQLFTIASVDGSGFGNQEELQVNLYSGTEYVGTTSAAGHVTNTIVPEPTTATLSLLALMGLAARRRRK